MGSVYERASHGDVVFWVEHAFYFRSGDSEERTCPGICNTMDTCMCNTAFFQVLHIPQYVQYCLFLSIQKYPGIHASPGHGFGRVRRDARGRGR